MVMGNNRPEFGDVARALADYLETRGVLDVVPSDIAVGFAILQRLQRQRIHEARRAVVTSIQERCHSMEEGRGSGREGIQEGAVHNTPATTTSILQVGGGTDTMATASTEPTNETASPTRSPFREDGRHPLEA